jgi:hypothetical protein
MVLKYWLLVLCAVLSMAAFRLYTIMYFIYTLVAWSIVVSLVYLPQSVKQMVTRRSVLTENAIPDNLALAKHHEYCWHKQLLYTMALSASGIVLALIAVLWCMAAPEPLISNPTTMVEFKLRVPSLPEHVAFMIWCFVAATLLSWLTSVFVLIIIEMYHETLKRRLWLLMFVVLTTVGILYATALTYWTWHHHNLIPVGRLNIPRLALWTAIATADAAGLAFGLLKINTATKGLKR